MKKSPAKILNGSPRSISFLYRALLLCIAFIPSLTISAAEPEGRLFRFERSTNRNYICYDVRQVNGRLDTKEPIHVYWIRAEEDGSQKELSFVQRKLAFGYKVVKKGGNEAVVHLTAYSKFNIRICQRHGKWIALASINGKEAQLHKLFAQMRSPTSLHVEYVDIFGTGLDTHKPVSERIRN
ncbi:MAG: DUF4833 domain-containing protein [Bacteroidales bacterium]|nr:DUF4833 domain-containing protein [Bacteroidales bacterium]